MPSRTPMATPLRQKNLHSTYTVDKDVFYKLIYHMNTGAHLNIDFIEIISTPPAGVTAFMLAKNLAQASKLCHRLVVTVWCRNNLRVPRAQQTSDVHEHYHVGFCNFWPFFSYLVFLFLRKRQMKLGFTWHFRAILKSINLWCRLHWVGKCFFYQRSYAQKICFHVSVC